MLKKLALLCCTIFVICSAVWPGIYAEEQTGITKEQELLVALDIISLNSYGEIDNAQEVTRAEFADICGKLLNINPSMTADKAYFTDVTPDKWYAYTINALTEQGIIAPAENKLFEPQRAITLNEAVKMLSCVMGYAEYAESRGGYPNGYLEVAASQKLLNGIPASTNNGNLTKDMMSKLVYNALHANVMKIDSIGTTPRYRIDPDETLLSYYMDIYADKGMVESVYGMSLIDSDVPDGQIRINGVNYYIGTIENAADYLGYQLKFYYRETEDGDRTLVYIEPLKKSELTVLSEDIENFEGLGNKLTYLSGDKQKSVTIASDAVIIRNGAIVKENVDEAFDIKNGEMKLISDNSSVYNTVIIYDFETIVVNTFDMEKGVLTDAIDHQLIIDLSECEYISVFSEDGEQLDLSAITKGAVVDIAYSENHAFIYVNSRNFEGKIEAIHSSNTELSVNGISYPYLEKAYDYYLMKLGYEGLFKLNRYGKIAYFEIKGSDLLPGYVLDVLMTDESEDERAILKILTASGNVERINVSQKVRMDGIAIKDNVENLFPIKNKVILYNINKEGKIVKIDSILQGVDDSDTSLKQEMAVNTEGHRWNSTYKMFDRNVICSPNMIIFKVPPTTSNIRDEDAYTVVDSSVLVNNRMYQAEAYKYGKTSYCDVVVLYETKYINNTRDAIIVVEAINEGIDENGDEVYFIEGYQRGSEITLQLERPHDLLPKVGDCIRVAKDKNGKVGLIEIHYDIERNGSGMCDTEAYWYWPPVNGEPYDAINNYWNGTFRDLQGDFRLGFGYPVEVDGNILKWSFNKGSDSIDELVLMKDSVPIIVYEADKKRNAFYEGSLSDIKTQESYGDDCSIIVANFSWGDLISLYVINNRDQMYGD